MLRRISAILIILGGLALLVVPVAEHVWTGAPPAKQMIDSFTPVMTSQSLGIIQSDLSQLAAADNQLSNQTMPALAGQLHMTPAQLQSAMATNFPAVATGMAQLPGILTHFDTYGGLLQSQLSNFQEASTIPVKGVPMTVLPYGFALVGVLALGLGVLMLIRPGRGPALGALALGVVVIVASLALSFPHKAVSADHMITGLKPVMTTQSVDGMGQSLQVVSAMINQMEGQMLPYVATQLHMAPTVFGAFLQTQFPAVGTALQHMPTTLATFAAIHDRLAANISNYSQAAQIPSMTFLIWLFIGVGAIALLGGALGAFSGASSGGNAELRSKESNGTLQGAKG